MNDVWDWYELAWGVFVAFVKMWLAPEGLVALGMFAFVLGLAVLERRQRRKQRRRASRRRRGQH